MQSIQNQAMHNSSSMAYYRSACKAKGSFPCFRPTDDAHLFARSHTMLIIVKQGKLIKCMIISKLRSLVKMHKHKRLYVVHGQLKKASQFNSNTG